MDSIIPSPRSAPASAVAIALAVLASACVNPNRGAAPLDVARRPDFPVILALMPESESARQTFRGIVDELGEDFDVVPVEVTPELDPLAIARVVRQERPKAMVLMNNPTLRLFRRYQVMAPPDQRGVPAVAVLTSFLRESGAGIDGLTGIIYEVPLVTSLVNLRALVEQPIRRVGVLYRPVFTRFLAEQRKLSATEGFELVGIEVSGDNAKEVEDGLRELTEVAKVDAVWVLNDNRLLAREILVKGWLPALRRNPTPVIVNVRSLLSREVSFGTFAVLPDHRALGVQAAQVLSGLADRNWKLEFPGEYEYPISVRKVLDVRFARRHLKLREQQLVTVDQLVE